MVTNEYPRDGAQTCSVQAGLGINSNSSGGTGGIPKVALQLAKFSTNIVVQFGWWPGEKGLWEPSATIRDCHKMSVIKVHLQINFDNIIDHIAKLRVQNL